MYNWKKDIISMFVDYCNLEKKHYTTTNDKTNKKLIDKFMEYYKEYFENYKYKSDFISIKKFLYVTFLDKYTNVNDFWNTESDKLFDL